MQKPSLHLRYNIFEERKLVVPRQRIENISQFTDRDDTKVIVPRWGLNINYRRNNAENY